RVDRNSTTKGSAITLRAAVSQDRSTERVARESTSRLTPAAPSPTQPPPTPVDLGSSPDKRSPLTPGWRGFPPAILRPSQKQAIGAGAPTLPATPLCAALRAPCESLAPAASCSQNTPLCQRSR